MAETNNSSFVRVVLTVNATIIVAGVIGMIGWAFNSNAHLASIDEQLKAIVKNTETLQTELDTARILMQALEVKSASHTNNHVLIKAEVEALRQRLNELEQRSPKE